MNSKWIRFLLEQKKAFATCDLYKSKKDYPMMCNDYADEYDIGCQSCFAEYHGEGDAT